MIWGKATWTGGDWFSVSADLITGAKVKLPAGAVVRRIVRLAVSGGSGQTSLATCFLADDEGNILGTTEELTLDWSITDSGLRAYNFATPIEITVTGDYWLLTHFEAAHYEYADEGGVSQSISGDEYDDGTADPVTLAAEGTNGHTMYAEGDELLSAIPARLITINGTEAAPLATDDLEPVASWVDPNDGTTHWRVKVYDSADSLVWDSTETAVGVTYVTIDDTAELVAGDDYYVVVTLMRGSGGSTWSVDSVPGWFTPAHASWSVAAPVLDAEADCTTADLVTLEWTASVMSDPEAPDYTVEVTDPDVVVTTYEIDAGGTSLLLGLCAAGTWSWRVMATDEHGTASAYSSADSFTVTAATTVPVVTLAPLPTDTDTTPRSLWTYTDPQGDAQTDYECELYSDASYETLVQDSGTVTSGSLYHLHTTLTAGTYYRQVRIQAGGEWSSWVQDSFVVVAPTAQTDQWELYKWVTDAWVAIDLETYPIAGVEVQRSLQGGGTEIRFTVHNFDRLKAGLATGTHILLYLKDTDGNRLPFRGEIRHLEYGRFVSVVARDISWKFEKWQTDVELDHVTIGQAVTTVVENPTGDAATGIVVHAEECEDLANPGQPLILSVFEGQMKTVAAVLAEFQKITNFRWYVEWNLTDEVWELWWFDPVKCPDAAYTVKDYIGYEAESATQVRCINDPQITSEGIAANRVKYWGRYEAPSLPPGCSRWDDVWTESDDLWVAYSGVTVAADATHKVVGTNSIKFTKTYTVGQTIPKTINLGYFLIPEDYRDMSSRHFGAFHVACDLDVTLPGWGYGQPTMEMILHHNSNVGPPYDGYNTKDTQGTNVWSFRWSVQGSQRYSIFPIPDSALNSENINAVQIRIKYPDGNYPTLTAPAGGTTFELWIDNLSIVGNSEKVGGPEFGSNYVQTDAVTAGTEVPMEVELDNGGLSMSAAEALATQWLAILQSGRTYLRGPMVNEATTGLQLFGMRNVPHRVNVPVSFAWPDAASMAAGNHGFHSLFPWFKRFGTGGTPGGVTPVFTGSYPLVGITWKPADSGHITELHLGSLVADGVRGVVALINKVNGLGAEARG